MVEYEDKKLSRSDSKVREISWVVRLIYHSIRKPIWTFGVLLWRCTKSSNQLIIQRSQNKFLGLVSHEYCDVANEELPDDQRIRLVSEVIQISLAKH